MVFLQRGPVCSENGQNDIKTAAQSLRHVKPAGQLYFMVISLNGVKKKAWTKNMAFGAV